MGVPFPREVRWLAFRGPRPSPICAQNLSTSNEPNARPLAYSSLSSAGAGGASDSKGRVSDSRSAAMSMIFWHS